MEITDNESAILQLCFRLFRFLLAYSADDRHYARFPDFKAHFVGVLTCLYRFAESRFSFSRNASPMYRKPTAFLDTFGTAKNRGK